MFHEAGGARIQVVLAVDRGAGGEIAANIRKPPEPERLKIATAKFSRAVQIFALKLACPRDMEAHEVRPIWVTRAHIGIQFKLLSNKARHRIRIFGDGAPQFVIS
jgi:hypothetical protein